MRRFLFSLMVLIPLAIVWGCKKGGPTVPYDASLPNTSGNLVVGVKDKSGAGVTNVSVSVSDYLGNVFSGTTDFTGTTSFNFDFKKYFIEQESPSFTISLPKQYHFNASSHVFVPANGANTVLFNTSPSLICSSPLAAPTSYAYNIDNSLVATVSYQDTGNLDIPVSIAAQNVPSGWSVNYDQTVLSRSVSQASVTFVIPAHEYRQQPISFWGFYANNPEASYYIASPTFTFTRGFPVTLSVSSAVSVGSNFVFKQGSIMISTVNGAAIPWNYSYKIWGPPAGGGSDYTFLDASGSLTGSGTANMYPDGSHQFGFGTPVYESLHVWNDNVGSFTASNFMFNTVTSSMLGYSVTVTHGSQTY